MKRTEENANKAFADHVLTVRLDTEGPFRAYRCQKPDSWTYGFDVTFTPGWVTIAGDIGFLALSRCADMLPWLRGTVARDGCIDFRYVAEKAPHCIVTREWTNAAAHAMVDRVLAAEEEGVAHDKRMDLHYFSDQTTWQETIVPALSKMCQEWYEYGDAKDWTTEFLYCVFGLRWCVRAIDCAKRQEVEV